ncbi:MAG TPA: RDD family protein [Actinospica sp.]|nr:RDD family protein [Actinospica sp.]
MSTGNPPAGYYADPSIPGYIRYWDGEGWVAGTSRPAPDEVADQVLASSQADAVPAADSGSWQPEPAAGSDAPAAGLDQSQGSAAGRSGARGYAQVPQQQPRHSRVEEPQAQVQQPQQYAEIVQSQPIEPQVPAQPQQYAQVVQSQPIQPQSEQYAPSPAPAPAHAPQPQQPEPVAAREPESVATMVVPSAFAPSQRTGTYRLPGNINNPFAGLPGSNGLGFAIGPEDDEAGEGEATVVELATPGSRFLGRIIDIGIAAIFSAPISVTLLLIAHRHDHQYVLKLDAQATTTYTTLGMDAVGIALWAGALAAFLIVSIVYEGYRLGRGGQTFGKRLAGVQVIQLPGGRPLGKGGAGTRRALIFWVLAVIPLVDVLALGGVLWGRPYRQGLHERATSTVTVKA